VQSSFFLFAAVTLASLPHAGGTVRVAQASPSPSASSSPSLAPVPTASPGLIAPPQPIATNGLVLPPVPALQTVAPGSTAPPSGAIVGTDEPFVGLSLQDAIGMALAHNTDLAVSQSNRRVAAYQIVSAAGAYDLQLQIQPSYTFQTTPALSPFNTGVNGSPDQTVTAGTSIGVSGLTGSGGRIQASTSAERIDNNNLYDAYNPYYQTAFALTYSQPLVRGRAIDQVREQIQLSRINSQEASDSALLTASNTIDNVTVAYDNLVAAWKNVGIEEDALRQAEAQSQSNGRLVRQGQAAPVDIVQSDEQVSEFQNNVYAAIQSVATSQNQIKQLILSDPADAVWVANLVPTTPVGMTPAEPGLEDVMLAALKNRPEVAQLRDNLRSQDVRVAYDKDQTRPQVDLNIGVTENGFAGAPSNLQTTPLFSVIGGQITAINELIARANAAAPGLPPLVPINGAALNTPLQPNSVGNVGTSYKSALAGQYPEYEISATIGFPLNDRVAKANYQASVEQRASIVTQEVALVQRLQSESRNAVQSYRSARARLIAATAARSAAEQVAASEVRKFRAGTSTTYFVLQRQVMLANERNRELQAQTDVQNALVELDRVTGDILSKNNVDVGSLGSAPHGAVPDLLKK
jgi:outer membrane protein TolC